jgi:hypothetical protein
MEPEQQEAHEAAEEKVADLLFGKAAEEPAEAPTEEVVEESTEEEYQPDPKPVEEGEESELVEFEFDGELLEATPQIRDALMRQQDYTQKTQEVSAQRKQVEVIQGELEQTRKQFEFAQSIQDEVIKAQQLEQQAEQWHQYLRDNIDDLSSTDIEKIRLQVDDSRRERDKIIESLKAKQQEYQQASEQSVLELRNKGTEVLRSKIPGWGEESQKQVREYALHSGFTEAEIAQVLDPRQVEVLWKASQFDALQQGKTAAVQKVQAAPSIKAKSRNPMPKDVKDKLNLRKKLKSKTISQTDKAQLIGENLANKFGM